MTIRRLEQMMIKNTMNLRQLGYAGIAFTVLSFVSGCATLEQPKEEVDVSAYSNLTTVDAVKELETNLKESEANELAVFAPKHFSTADKALIEARSLISKNEPRDQVVQKVAVASAVLRNGDMVMRKVKDILEDQLVVKKKLDSLQTKQVYRSEYGSLEERLNSIIREIESGNITKTEQNRGKLLQDLQKLERRSIRYNAMHEPEEILKRVKYRGGEKLAPLTYDDAMAVFQRAEEFIAQNPTYETGIEQMGQEALFAAKRALYITEQVAALSQKVSISLEQVVLDEEYRMYRVARELNSVDLRDNPLEMQSERLAQIARNKSEEYRNKEGLIIALRDTLIKVRDSSAELTALNEISARLKKEKDEWLAKEALYKAKVANLENNLSKSQAQLDQTQQKLLSINDKNSQLFNALNIEKKNAQELQVEISKTKAKVEAMTTVANQTTKEKPQVLTNPPEKIKTIESNALPSQNIDENANIVKIDNDVTADNESEKTAAISTKQAPQNMDADAKVVNFDKNVTTDNKTEQAAIISTKQPLTLVEETPTIEDGDKELASSKSTEAPKITETTLEEMSEPVAQTNVKQSEKLATSTTTSADNGAKSQITEKETIDALKSVMELINIKSETPTTEKAIASKITTESVIKSDNEAFVDASE